MFDLVNITFIDILDIIIVGMLIYWLIRFIRGTAALNIFAGVLFLYVVWIASTALQMKLLSSILGQVLGVGVIALIVIFQPEIRRFLLRFGAKYAKPASGRIFRKLVKSGKSVGMSATTLEEITGACRKMAETKTGALIVISHNSPLQYIVETGDTIDANINRRLIENIFFKNTPLHDGAMVISHDKIIAARCTLPITENPDIPPRYGMRHRAAIGISEQSDASVIVVSEETGEISFVENGVIKTLNSLNELHLAIENSYK